MIKLIAVNIGLYAFVIAAISIAIAAFLEWKDLPFSSGDPYPAELSFQLFSIFYFGPFCLVALHLAKLPFEMAMYLWRSAQ